MSDIVINDDFTALAELLDRADECLAVAEYGARTESLQRANDAVLERVRAEVAAKSDGLRRAIVYYERLAEDAKRVVNQSEARAALIREYVKGEMQAAGVRSVKTATGLLTVRGNGGLQPLSVSQDELPEEYTRVTVIMPHAMWSVLCDLYADDHAIDLTTVYGVTIRTEPDNARIREALAKQCAHCNGTGTRDLRGTVMELGCDPADLVKQCPECGGTGRFTIPGAHLAERGESLVVK